MDSSNRKKVVNISMDVEDVYGDVHLLNQHLENLVDFFNNNQIYCDIYLTGIRLAQIEYENPELINKVNSKFINVGYHSNTHSFFLLPMIEEIGYKIEKIEEEFFDVSRMQFYTHKTGGIKLFRKYYDSKMFRCPAFCWTPQYFKYMRKWGMQYTTIDINIKKPIEFMGLTVIPVVEKPLEAIQNIDEIDNILSDYNVVSVYFHPARLLYDQFWDKDSEHKLYDDLIYRTEKVKELIIRLKEKYDIISLNNIDNYITEDDVYLDDAENILSDSMIAKWKWSQLPQNYYNTKHVNELKSEIFSYKPMRIIC